MPLALVKYNHIHPRAVAEVTRLLPTLVAEALTVKEADGQLTPVDVEVFALEENCLDVNPYHLGIVIFANDYPSRRAKLDEARADIIRGLEAGLPDILRRYEISRDIKGFVWILLCPGSFGEFAI